MDCVAPLRRGGARRNSSGTSRCGSPLLLLMCALLMTSAHSEGHGEVVSVLLEHRADPNMTSAGTGDSPLLSAVDAGSFEIVKMLLEHNANPNQANTAGSMPVYLAAYDGTWHPNVANTLRI